MLRVRLPAVVVASFLTCLGAWAQAPETQPATQPAAPDLGALRAELLTSGGTFDPAHPIRVVFAIVNAGTTPIELPDAAATVDGMRIPNRIVFGTAEEPALRIAFGTEPAVPVLRHTSIDVQPPIVAADPGVRLAPGGAVGAELDLREVYRPIRYPGLYKLTWTPFGPSGPTASLSLRIEPRRDAILVTDLGRMTFQLRYDEAPVNVENFLDLVRSGFYAGKTFHRVVPGYLIQGGCPNGDGAGGRPDGKLVPAEFDGAPVEAGTLVMARKPSDPNSASSQFFIALDRLPELDGQYTVIGRTRDEESLRTLRQLARVAVDARNRPKDRLVIRSITLVEAESNARRSEVRAP